MGQSATTRACSDDDYVVMFCHGSPPIAFGYSHHVSNLGEKDESFPKNQGFSDESVKTNRSMPETNTSLETMEIIDSQPPQMGCP